MTVSDYIDRLADRSRTDEHELIVECLKHFGLCGTHELTLEQAAEWWEIVRRR